MARDQCPEPTEQEYRTVTWIKLDDDFPDHPKMRKIFRKGGSDAMWLHIAGLCHSSRFLTDGFIAAEDVEDLTLLRNPTKALNVLLTIPNVWKEVPGGYQIINYLDHQRSRADIEHEREMARKRQEERRARSRARFSEPHAGVTDASRRDTPVSHAGVTPLDTDTDTDTDKNNTLAAVAAEERKDLSGAIFDAIGLDPAILLTGSEQSQLNIAAAELHKVGATVADVRERSLVYRARWPDMALTPMALVKHWSALGVMAEDTLGAKVETEADHRDSLKRWAAQWDYLPDEEFFETARNLFPDPSDLEVVASYRSVEA